ncbi:glycosyltransferase [Paenibacillus sp. S-38]|uniref:glycosyltransferase n=1 Tax=Paenibacillus sp. S-38 TaxID=3416710 RepID=UPI003CF3ADBF
MRTPRIYWICSHETLRYEEVPLLIEAGAEVIPCLGDPTLVKFDQNYDNETHKYYPHWRKYCTLPTYIAEEIRRIDIIGKRGKVTSREAALINQHIDVLYIASFPDLVANALDWFNGYVIFRVFGHGDFSSYTKAMEFLRIDKAKFAASKKYIWSPILYSLDEPEAPELVRNKLYLNAFVSEERLGFRWRAGKSEPYLSTAISYLDGAHPAQDVYSEFASRFEALPYIVLGKNHTKGQTGGQVSGYLDSTSFYSKIASSRMFIYIGFHSFYHLHFTPLEAMCMGVPVLFLYRSGLTKEALDHSVSLDLLRETGMCATVQELQLRASELFHDLEALEDLSRRQYALFRKVFSRAYALGQLKRFYRQIQNELPERSAPSPQAHLVHEEMKPLYRKPSIKTDLPTHAGQFAAFSLESVGALTGTPVYHDNETFACRKAEAGRDAPGLLIAEYIQSMVTGVYAFSIIITASERSDRPVGSFSMGTWVPDFTLYAIHPIEALEPGEHLVTLHIHIDDDTAHALKELRFQWEGQASIEVSELYVEKLT